MTPLPDKARNVARGAARETFSMVLTGGPAGRATTEVARRLPVLNQVERLRGKIVESAAEAATPRTYGEAALVALPAAGKLPTAGRGASAFARAPRVRSILTAAQSEVGAVGGRRLATAAEIAVRRSRIARSRPGQAVAEATERLTAAAAGKVRPTATATNLESGAARFAGANLGSVSSRVSSALKQPAAAASRGSIAGRAIGAARAVFNAAYVSPAKDVVRAGSRLRQGNVLGAAKATGAAAIKGAAVTGPVSFVGYSALRESINQSTSSRSTSASKPNSRSRNLDVAGDLRAIALVNQVYGDEGITVLKKGLERAKRRGLLGITSQTTRDALLRGSVTQEAAAAGLKTKRIRPPR